jgi:hypothetical protein
LAIVEEEPEALNTKSFSKLEQQDPELVYKLELMRMKDAVQKAVMMMRRAHAALAARSCFATIQLRRFVDQAQWDGCYEMVNVTYIGDIADCPPKRHETHKDTDNFLVTVGR